MFLYSSIILIILSSFIFSQVSIVILQEYNLPFYTEVDVIIHLYTIGHIVDTNKVKSHAYNERL